MADRSRDVLTSATPDRGPGHIDARGFFDQLVGRFDEAAQTRQVVRRHRIAGRVVELRFAGEALVEPLGAAFGHLAVRGGDGDDTPDLTVLVFDAESTGVGRPPAPWTTAALGDGGLVDGFCDASFHTVFEVWLGSLTMVDFDRRLAVCWLENAGRLSTSARAAPLWKLMYSYFDTCGMVLTHSGAVGRPDGGFLLAGRSGAGKSSTALSCLGSGLGYAADDYCLVEPGSPPMVHSIYSTGKTHGDQAGRFADLALSIVNRDRLDTEKAIYFLHPRFADDLSPGFPLRAVIAPVVRSGQATALRPTSRGTALVAAAATTVMFAPHTARRALTRLAEVVRSLPAFELVLGDGAERVPAMLGDLLEELA